MIIFEISELTKQHYFIKLEIRVSQNLAKLGGGGAYKGGEGRREMK